MCRICLDTANEKEHLLTPCKCSGTMKFIHHSCLTQWYKISAMTQCELCHYPFAYRLESKPQSLVPSWRRDQGIYKVFLLWLTLLLIPLIAFTVSLCLILMLHLQTVVIAIFVGVMLCAVVAQVSLAVEFNRVLRTLIACIRLRDSEITFFDLGDEISPSQTPPNTYENSSPNAHLISNVRIDV
ncbi:E3-MARCH3-like protein [Vombatid gammaherpesvirus 1]|uniref:E3-MARCH3-like protein n=1 Tax=Vombatid gammaherpesvirus 1 TaxID=2052651 RepID=A0A3S8D7N0_9GAMA|nr:E3-MARCH3-like protein [Vombatid gammaherpesvirus 1]AZB49175.1 E3-MARCH3-like protein [Vombatid gammaherpesvirus 1]